MRESNPVGDDPLLLKQLLIAQINPTVEENGQKDILVGKRPKVSPASSCGEAQPRDTMLPYLHPRFRSRGA